jgi:hypothetical protein
MKKSEFNTRAIYAGELNMQPAAMSVEIGLNSMFKFLRLETQLANE